MNGKLFLREGCDLTQDERHQLSEERERLRIWLRPATDEEIGALVWNMRKGWPRYVQEPEPAARGTAMAFVMGLEGVAYQALEHAVRAALGPGRAGFDPKYEPSVSQLATIADRITEPARRRLAEVEEVLAAREEDPAPTVRKVSQAKIDGLIGDLAKAAQPLVDEAAERQAEPQSRRDTLEVSRHLIEALDRRAARRQRAGA